MVRTRIIGTGSYLPERVLTNIDLEKMVETSDHWITERTGIKERRLAKNGEATSDLSVRAAMAALQSALIEPEQLDLIIVATATPDMLFPSTACLVQDRIGAKRAAAFDLSAACSGFIFALSVADQFVRSGTYSTIMVIGAEVLSKIVDWKDRNTCVLFGDGAGAVVVKGMKGERGILSTHIHSDGSLWDLIYVPGGGSRFPPSLQTIRKKLNFMKMKGNETFKVAVRTLEEAAMEALKYNDLSPSDIDLYMPHQANYRIIQAVAQRLNIPAEKVLINLERYGNTSAASIPVALDEANRTGRVKAQDILLLEAFGGGLTWGSVVIRW